MFLAPTSCHARRRQKRSGREDKQAQPSGLGTDGERSDRTCGNDLEGASQQIVCFRANFGDLAEELVQFAGLNRKFNAYVRNGNNLASWPNHWEQIGKPVCLTVPLRLSSGYGFQLFHWQQHSIIDPRTSDAISNASINPPGIEQLPSKSIRSVVAHYAGQSIMRGSPLCGAVLLVDHPDVGQSEIPPTGRRSGSLFCGFVLQCRAQIILALRPHGLAPCPFSSVDLEGFLNRSAPYFA
ncbi:hypothetical protein C8R45DRAFT_1139458 [Mycena sanguinolenta]|nr:hypothetical protein C8R45DRAFT_1139458 [Mycena sanguinolenta]